MPYPVHIPRAPQAPGSTTVRSCRVSAIFVALLLMPWVLPAGAHAQTDNAPEAADEAPYNADLDQAARIRYQQGTSAFDSGDYDTALERFRQAYELSPRPALLYNIAATLDRLRRDEEAADALRAYLEAVPDAPDRTEIEARLRVLDAAIAERHAAEEARAAQAAEEEARRQQEERELIQPPPPEERSGLHPAIAISVGGAALVAGGLIVWSGLDARSRNDDYETYARSAGANREEARRLFDETRSAETRTNILIGVTGALAAASAILFVFTDFGGGDDDDVAIRVGATPDGGAAFVGGSF